MTILEFLSNLKEDTNGCLIWQGRKDPNNYGRCSYDGVEYQAHRLAYELFVGPIPIIDGEPALLRHNCDNPPCCNWLHLTPGTSLDNARDRVERGRSAVGAQNNPATFVTDDMVRLIRALRAKGLKYRTIASLLHITMGVVVPICQGKSWTHVK